MKLIGDKTDGQIRHILTAGGGVLVALGLTDEDTAAQGVEVIMTAIGSVTVAVGFIWSAIAKMRAG